MPTAICPTCKRRMPATAKPKMDRRLAADLASAEAAIVVCESAATGIDTRHMAAAILAERDRLVRMLSDWRLLWRVYRRKDKGAPYYDVAGETANEAVSVDEIA